ncbi:MAG: hypothetical protein VX871_06575 [Pseudomonadota bacterium]|nr:hypothetical protein [Pseudomonadota bacterium]
MRKSLFGVAAGVSTLAIACLAATPADAGGRHNKHGYYYKHHYHGGYPAAAIVGLGVGAAIGAAIAAPPPYLYTESYYSPYAPDYPPTYGGYSPTYSTYSPPPAYQTYAPPPAYQTYAQPPAAYQNYDAPQVYRYTPPQTYKGGTEPYAPQPQTDYQGYRYNGAPQDYAQNGPAPQPGSAEWYTYCWSKYPDFEPKSGTYGGPDGRRHVCR